MTSANLADVKARLSEYMSRALGGERIEVTRRGRPVAVILSPDEYHRLATAAQPETFAEAAARFQARLPSDEDLPDLAPLVRDRSEGSRKVNL